MISVKDITSKKEERDGIVYIDVLDERQTFARSESTFKQHIGRAGLFQNGFFCFLGSYRPQHSRIYGAYVRRRNGWNGYLYRLGQRKEVLARLLLL